MLWYLINDVKINSAPTYKYKKPSEHEFTLLDKYLGIVIERLKKTDIYEHSIIAITGDRGQNCGEDHFYSLKILFSVTLTSVPHIIKLVGSRIVSTRGKYQSLTNLFNILGNRSEGMINTNLISDEIAHSKSFFIQKDYREMFRLDSHTINKLETFDHRLILTYTKRMKATAIAGDIKLPRDSATSNQGNVFLDKENLEELNGFIK